VGPGQPARDPGPPPQGTPGLLAIYEARLDPVHPLTAWNLSTSQTSCTPGATSPPPAASTSALAIYEARLGADHPDIQQSRRDLAVVESALREP
jgi:hypothetical protein